MTVVVDDTSPLNYLSLIEEISVLPRLYGEILIPPEVLAELTDADAPPAVLKWIETRPPWLRVCQARISQSDPALNQLDPGERAAIRLAVEQSDVLLLIDDAAGSGRSDPAQHAEHRNSRHSSGCRDPFAAGPSNRVEALERYQLPYVANSRFRSFSGAFRTQAALG